MEEKDNKEMTSAVRDTIAYIIAENIIDSINPHNPKQDLVQVLSNLHHKCDQVAIGWASFCSISMLMQNMFMDTLNIDDRFTPEEIGKTTAEIYVNAMSKIPIGKMLFTETKKVSKPRSVVSKIKAWIKSRFSRC